MTPSPRGPSGLAGRKNNPERRDPARAAGSGGAPERPSRPPAAAVRSRARRLHRGRAPGRPGAVSRGRVSRRTAGRPDLPGGRTFRRPRRGALGPAAARRGPRSGGSGPCASPESRSPPREDAARRGPRLGPTQVGFLRGLAVAFAAPGRCRWTSERVGRPDHSALAFWGLRWHLDAFVSFHNFQTYQTHSWALSY